MHKHEAGKNGGPPVRDNVIVMSGFGLSASFPLFLFLRYTFALYVLYFLDVRLLFVVYKCFLF